jgi:hypothetical protein
MEICDTDMANAVRLVARHGKDIKFTAARGWFIWDGRRWAADEKGLGVPPGRIRERRLTRKRRLARVGAEDVADLEAVRQRLDVRGVEILELRDIVDN